MQNILWHLIPDAELASVIESYGLSLDRLASAVAMLQRASIAFEELQERLLADRAYDGADAQCLRTLAHDIRNSLTTVLLSLQLIREETQDPAVDALIEKVRRSASHLTDILTVIRARGAATIDC